MMAMVEAAAPVLKLAAWLAPLCFLGVGGRLCAQPAPRATLAVQVWRLDYARADGERLDWQLFEAASEPAQWVPASIASASGPRESRQKATLARTADGYVRKGFALRRPAEKSYSRKEIQDRLDLFVKVLSEELGVRTGQEGEKGRRLIPKPDKERLVLIDTDRNALKAQVLYDSLFPVVVVTYREQPAPAPREGASLLIGALKTQHRSPAELESVLNRVSGRTRSSDEDRADSGQRQDRIPMRVAADSGSGRMVVAVPSEEGPSRIERVAPPRRSESSPVARASVHIEPPEVPGRERFRRFGPMDFAKLESDLRRLGKLSLLRERTLRVAGERPVSVSAGWGIPYIRCRPSKKPGARRSQTGQMRASIHFIPKFLGQDAWQATLLTELADYSSYPDLEKIYLDFDTRLRFGDTLVCKKLVPEEISGDRTLNPEVAGRAETLVFLTLLE